MALNRKKKMGRGRYKYICEECQAETWLSASERISKFRPRCSSCGSTWLEPSKKSKGPEKIANWHDRKKEYNDLQDKKMGKHKE